MWRTTFSVPEESLYVCHCMAWLIVRPGGATVFVLLVAAYQLCSQLHLS